MRGREGQGGRSCRALGATGRTWAFTPRMVGAWEAAEGVVGREGRDLTEGLTGALWWPLQGGQAVRGEGGSRGTRTQGTALFRVGDDEGWSR